MSDQDEEKPPVPGENGHAGARKGEPPPTQDQGSPGTAELTRPEPNYSESIEFLRRWSPEGPWALTYISLDRKEIKAAFFSPGQEKELLSWLEQHGATKNIYFSVNRLLREFRVKAEREDVASLDWLHVDIDPRPGEDVAKEQVRALKLLREHKLPPTVIVFSGGGYQGFWRLREPMRIDGQPALYEDAALFNKHLVIEFGADNCQNLDRIMRLPGTINWPNEKKRKKGQVVALAAVVEWHDERIFDLAQFQRAVVVQTPGNGHTVKVSGNVQRLANVDDLPEAVSQQCRMVIVQGHDPLEPNKFGSSRSEWLFYVCCELVRGGCTDDQIYAVITDPEFGISASVLDKSSRSERYALRQIERARERVSGAQLVLDKNAPLVSARRFAESELPTLMHHNDDWLVQSTVAYSALEDGTIRQRIYRFLDGALQLAETPVRFCPTKNKVSNVLDALRGETHVPRDRFEPPCWLDGEGPPPREIVACSNGLLHLPTGVLLGHTSRFFTRNALDFAFDPAAALPERWLGFLRELWPDDLESIATLQEIFGYLLIPDTSQQKLFLLIGPPRSGKGTIAHVLQRLVGAGNVCAPTLKGIATQFGMQPLIGKQVAIISDMRLGPKIDMSAVTENLLRITGEDTVEIHRKFKEAWEGHLAVRFLILTNLMPKFEDTGGALANRCVPLMLSESFLGRENHGLRDELIPDLPGILNWAIEGWRRLRARGHFALPSASDDALQAIAKMAAPVLGFLQDECELNSEAFVEKQALFESWRAWCARQGAVYTNDLSTFARDLLAVTKVRAGKGPRETGRRPVFRGVRLRPSEGQREPFA